MNIKEQVLSIHQVKELQELGFDVNKHASMCWIKYTRDEEPYEETYNLTILDENCYEMTCLAPIPTLSIGDIIEILPYHIAPEDSNRAYSLYIEKIRIGYESSYVVINEATYYRRIKSNMIDILFEALTWCIINNHIQCQ